MNKYTNPFFALKEAEAVLKSLGVDPLEKNDNEAPKSNYPFPWGNSYGQKPDINWRDYILSVAVNRVYVGDTHYHVVDLHMDFTGFERICALIRSNTDNAPEVMRCGHSEDYDMLYFEPSPLLKLFALVPIEQDKEVVCECDCGTQS